MPSSDQLHIDLGRLVLWTILTSLPYTTLLLPRIRQILIAFFKPREFVRVILGALGAATYPIIISCFLQVQNWMGVIVFSISYFAFIGTAAWINHFISIAITNENRQLKKENVELKEQNKVFRKLSKFHKQIEQLIEKKSSRFLNAYKQTRQSSSPEINAGWIFRQITKPDLQLRELFVMIKDVFSWFFCDAADDIHYSIMEPKGSHLEFTVWSKKPKSMDAAEYKQGTTFRRGDPFAASSAWSLRRLIIVEDIQKELSLPVEKRNYHFTSAHEHTSECGSLISYPVFDDENRDVFPDGLICVINLTSKTPQTFNENNRFLYEEIFSAFACRIVLEKRLELLKKGLKEEEQHVSKT